MVSVKMLEASLLCFCEFEEFVFYIAGSFSGGRGNTRKLSDFLLEQVGKGDEINLSK